MFELCDSITSQNIVHYTKVQSSFSLNASCFVRCPELTKILLFTPTGTYLTNEAKGAEDAPDADTAIINAEGSQVNAEEKKEYFI